MGVPPGLSPPLGSIVMPFSPVRSLSPPAQGRGEVAEQDEEGEEAQKDVGHGGLLGQVSGGVHRR